jgi:Ca-activated chloride channel family protein
MNGHEFDAAMDDPRLTAYALGELEGEEKAAIEQRLAADAEARALVAEIRAAAALLEGELAAAAPESRLAASRRAAVLSAAEGGAARRGSLRWLSSPRIALAALLLGGVTIAMMASRHGDEYAPFTYSLFGGEEGAARSNAILSATADAPPAATPATVGYAGAARGGATEARPEPKDQFDRVWQELGYTAANEPPHEEQIEEAIVTDRLETPIAAGEVPSAVVATSADEIARNDDEADAPLEKKRDFRGRLQRVKVEPQDGGLVQHPEFNTEQYAAIVENPFRRAAEEGLSTFSIDVDTASYTNARRFLVAGELPPAAAIRTEEFINYFSYEYPDASGEHPFSVTTELATCPWAPRHQIARIGIQGKKIDVRERKPTNLVFLIDVSGSMNGPDKLPLLKSAMKLLTAQLGPKDRVAITVYAGAAGLVLPSTSGDRHGEILSALDRLEAGGSTAGAAGIELAYRTAQQHLIEGGVNRVILATDGDFNVGVSDDGSLVAMIEEKRRTGVFLTVLGFGTGNLKDSKMEQLANKGNGNYAYIDTLAEAKKVLVEQVAGTLETIAKDVKIQVEFNPGAVEAWRLIGYENRVLAHQDFNDDKKDAGEIGAGTSVTALYEIVPKGQPLPEGVAPAVDASRYQPERGVAASGGSELLFLKLRYKQPDSDVSTLLQQPLVAADVPFGAASNDLRFAAAVAGFALKLRGSASVAQFQLDEVLAIAAQSRGEDRGGRRAEFLSLVAKANELMSKAAVVEQLRELGYIGVSEDGDR